MQIFTKYTKSYGVKKQVKLQNFVRYICKWNDKINVISRKDIHLIIENHLLPSLAFGKIVSFLPRTRVLDVGTGGGFPGIPLAICFPKTQFVVIDSIGKKIQLVQLIIEKLNLKNIKAIKIRAELVNELYDFVIGRAVTSLPIFLSYIINCLKIGSNHNLNNGVLYLKGGSLEEEINSLKITKFYQLKSFYPALKDKKKYILHISAQSIKKHFTH